MKKWIIAKVVTFAIKAITITTNTIAMHFRK